MLQLTSEQLKATEQGEAVSVDVEGNSFILLRRDIYEDELDFSPWTTEEIDLLAVQALQLVSGDGLDEDDDSNES